MRVQTLRAKAAIVVSMLGASKPIVIMCVCVRMIVVQMRIQLVDGSDKVIFRMAMQRTDRTELCQRADHHQCEKTFERRHSGPTAYQ